MKATLFRLRRWNISRARFTPTTPPRNFMPKEPACADGSHRPHAKRLPPSCIQARRPGHRPQSQWNLDHRRLLHHLSADRTTITIDGTSYSLRDTLFPTVDPTTLHPLCRRQAASTVSHSFTSSQKLWEHMQYLVNNADAPLRDDHLISRLHRLRRRGQLSSSEPRRSSAHRQRMFEPSTASSAAPSTNAASPTLISSGISGAVPSRPSSQGQNHHSGARLHRRQALARGKRRIPISPSFTMPPSRQSAP